MTPDAMTAYRVAMSDKSSQDTTTETRLTTLDGAVVDVCLWDDQTWVTAFVVDASGNRGNELHDEAVKSEEDLRGFLERVGVDPARAAEIWASSTRPAYYGKQKSRGWR